MITNKICIIKYLDLLKFYYLCLRKTESKLHNNYNEKEILFEYNIIIYIYINLINFYVF